jgi:hypothetical protein
MGPPPVRPRRVPAADAIVQLLAPTRVLVSGDAAGRLADELRGHGVEVHGRAEADSPGDDLAVHVGAAPAGEDAGALVDALCVADAVLLSTGSASIGEAGSDESPADWGRLFAERGLFRDADHDAGYLDADAVLFRRAAPAPALADVVDRYERALAAVRAQAEADVARLDAELQQLRKEVLRTRDLAFGRQAELASALARVTQLESTLARYDNVEQRLHDVLNSRSWRLTQTIGLPVRLLRQRR